MFRTSLWRIVACWTLPLLSQAQPLEHEPLTNDDQLTLHAVVESALSHAPQALETAARADQADAYSANGRSWLAARPNMQVMVYDDRTFNNTGLSEQEYWLQLPIWRLGERKDMNALGDGYQQQSSQWQHYLALMISGQVRQMLADIDHAHMLLDMERQALVDAESLRNVTARLVETGAAARLDLLQAENLLLQQRKLLLDAEAGVVDAEIVYATTTGLQSKPAQPLQEVQSSMLEISDAHPVLQYLRASVDVAEGNLRQTEITAKGNPQIGIGTRHQRTDRFSSPIDTINIGITVPFGGKSYVSSTTSAARRSKVDAEVELMTARRSLALALHEAEHQLETVRAALPLAEEQASLAQQRSRMAQTAFATGEVTMAQVVPALQDARTSQRELLSLQLQERRLISQYNQAIGNIP